MTAEQMLTRLQANYQTLEAQFQKTDLSTIPAAKLVELMLRHALAIQKALQPPARPADPLPAPKPIPTPPAPQSEDKLPPPAPAVPASLPPSDIRNSKSEIAASAQSKTCPRACGDLKSKIPSPLPPLLARAKSKLDAAQAALDARAPSDPAQDILDRLRERSQSLAAEMARSAGLLPPAPTAKEPPYHPFRQKTTVPPRSPTR